MLTLMQQGGPLMWLLLFNAFIAFVIFCERFLYYHRAHINTADFVAGIRNALNHGNTAESLALCDETPGPVAEVIKAGISTRDRRREEIHEAMEDAARIEVARLERRLVVLATIAQITPLIGFLGTVAGLISMFKVMQATLLPNPGQLAGGVWEALLTTAGGLVVAIPAYVGYNYLVSRMQLLVLDMEKAANEIINLLTRPVK